MSIVSKNVFIVKCNLSTFTESFSRKKNSEIINHYEIRQRLTNNDVFKTPPTDEIVNFQIMKKLNNFKDCKKTDFLFFYQDDIEDNFVNGLKSFFSDSLYAIHYHLLLESSTKNTKLKKQFNTIQIIGPSWS